MAQPTIGIQPAKKAKPVKKKTPFRPDIQGLHAVAVLLVIADHLFGYPRGGFIGVDVFFVISGYLISGLLIREHQKSGRISFADFYRRRARRILPLSLLVLAVTVAASWLLFSGSRAAKITEDGVWSLLFATNWHLAIIGTDYMQADGVVSPLQHFWSLAVEEQFYFVWPWLMILVLGFLVTKFGLSKDRSALRLGATMVIVIAVSFVFATWETSTSPTFAYFSTFSRAWELGVGAIVAVLASQLARIPDRLRSILSYAGLLGIAYSAFAITTDMPFPAPWAALPVLATALVIAAGTGGDVRHMAPLTNRVSRYVGDISFSLYLWHFPVMVLFAAVVPVQEPFHFAVVLTVTLGISSLSYHFLEDPMRKSNWLEPSRRGSSRQPSGDKRLAYGGLIGLALTTMVVCRTAMAKIAPANVPQTVPVTAPTASLAKGQVVTATSKLAGSIVRALNAPAWPALSPSIDELGPAAKAPEWIDDGCLAMETKSLEDPVENALRCTYGDASAKKTAVVMGDSIAISYVPAIRASLVPQGYRVQVFTMQQCPWVSVTVLQGSKAPHPQCDSFRDWALSEVQRTKPDLVLLSGNYSVFPASGAKDSALEAEWVEGSKTSFEGLLGAKRIVVLDPPPSGKPMAACATRISIPLDCESKAEGLYDLLSRANRTAAEALAGRADVEFPATKDWFCTANRRCPSFVGTTPVYADGFHLTSKFSVSLGPVLNEALSTVKVP